ncbi:MAG: D-amino acid dehydrogenase [Proteobacteria bacterium]|nr:D-amino acid dehydrogenase [Pseudomonadota bacterium]
MRIAVIGAGIIGVSLAYFLREDGHDVFVIEQNNGPALETSFANGGLLTPSLSDPWNSPGILWRVLKYLGRQDTPILFRLNALPSLGTWGLNFLKYSTKQHYFKNIEKNATLGNLTNKLLKDLTQKTSLDFDFNPRGTLMILRDKEELKEASSLADFMSRLSVPYQVLNKQALIDKEPSLAPIQDELVAGIFYPDDASGDANAFTRNLSRHLASHSVRFFYNATAKLVKAGSKVDILLGNEKLDVEAIVLCGGVQSPVIAKSLGIDLPIRPCKGYSLTLDCDTWSTMPQLPVIDHAFHMVATPLGKRLRVAGTAEFAGFNKTLTASRVQNLVSILHKVFPQGMANTDSAQILPWTGLRPTCVDGVPLIGPSKYENLFINTGHGHLGWTMSLGSGKILADYFSGRPSEISLADYSLTRFC